ncbi:MAG: 30S ribosomal protein S26e [Promethearchaeota archaeon]
MPKKRKSGGRTGSQKGRSNMVQCAKCGRIVPREKAKRFRKKVSFVEFRVAKELRESGAILPRGESLDWYCISCAIHSHKINIRSKANRKGR